jgi:transcriptional regulator with XRE-family HTH domain
MAVSKQKQATYLEYRGKGLSQKDAGIKAGISLSSAYRIERDHKATPEGIELRNKVAEARLLGPIPYEKLSKDAKRGYDDFGFFLRRYFGVKPFYWQEESAARLQEYLETPDREFCVISAPPGVGKSTQFTHWVPAWLTVRDRTIKGLIGSVSHRLATQYTNQLMRTLERTFPVQGDPALMERGLAFDADGCLAIDYGRFKSEGNWTKEQFVVEQFGRQLVVGKEPTWAAYGAEGEQIGHRARFIVWDDLVSIRNQSTNDQREKMERTWDDIAEARLEPGGVLVLQGQRLMADDLYSYNLRKRVTDPDADELERPKYHHIKYKVHYDELCTGEHPKNPEPWPNGCLLAPTRMTWRDVLNVQDNPSFETVWQQEDSNPGEIFVEKDWIDGDASHIGCKDRDRGYLEMPPHKSNLFSVATCDPSVAKYWAIEWWIYDPDTERRYLIDLEKRRMTAGEFLDREGREFTGLMEQWQTRSIQMGYPITHWIIEQNAAHSYLFQFNHARDWIATRGVEVLKHSTQGANKNQALYGIGSLPSHFKYGRVRLPYGDEMARRVANRMIEEVLAYPRGRYDDAVMAYWFLEWNLPHLSLPHATTPRQWVPSWA